MTKHEAAVISAFSGIMLGKFSDLHEYVEKLLDRPVFTHEFGCEPMAKKIKDAAYNDFIKISKEIE